MGTATEDSFNKFCKNNLMEKGNHIFKTIKLAYEIRTNKTKMNSIKYVINNILNVLF